MNDLKRDMAHIQELVGTAFNQTGGLVALGDGGQMSPEKLEKTLEQTMDCFERATLELRRMCETYAPGVGGYQRKHPASRVEAAGYVEQFGYGWVHIVLQTLLPHCRYQTPAWLTDTIRRLLDEYEAGGSKLPCFERAMLVIDEHSGIEGRHIFDQDNKGWKAVSNALKGRLFPDDDQYTLAISLLSTKSPDNLCHITLLDLSDAADFFAVHSGHYAARDFYAGGWP